MSKNTQALAVGVGGIALVSLVSYLLAGLETPHVPTLSELGDLAHRELPFGAVSAVKSAISQGAAESAAESAAEDVLAESLLEI